MFCFRCQFKNKKTKTNSQTVQTSTAFFSSLFFFFPLLTLMNLGFRFAFFPPRSLFLFFLGYYFYFLLFFLIHTRHAVSGVSFSCICKTLQSCWTAVRFWVFCQCSRGWWGALNPGTRSTERQKLLDLWCYTSWVLCCAEYLSSINMGRLLHRNWHDIL